jgi:hypothetical protein
MAATAQTGLSAGLPLCKWLFSANLRAPFEVTNLCQMPLGGEVVMQWTSIPPNLNYNPNQDVERDADNKYRCR